MPVERSHIFDFVMACALAERGSGRAISTIQSATAARRKSALLRRRALSDKAEVRWDK